MLIYICLVINLYSVLHVSTRTRNVVKSLDSNLKNLSTRPYYSYTAQPYFYKPKLSWKYTKYIDSSLQSSAIQLLSSLMNNRNHKPVSSSAEDSWTFHGIKNSVQFSPNAVIYKTYANRNFIPLCT